MPPRFDFGQSILTESSLHNILSLTNNIFEFATGLLCQLPPDGGPIPEGFKLCDERITGLRWATAGISVAGMLICLSVLGINAAVEAAMHVAGRQPAPSADDKVAAILNDEPRLQQSLATADIVFCIIAPTLTLSAIHQFNLYDISISIFVLLLLFIALTFFYFVPRGFAASHPEKTLARWGGFVRVETTLITPLVWLANMVSTAVLRRAKINRRTEDTTVEEELGYLPSGNEEHNALPEGERQMLRGLVELGETTVRELMKPRLDVKAAPINASLDELLDLILTSGHSRLPIYQENIDQIIGVLYAKDLLKQYRRRAENPGFDIAKLVRPVYFVPESKKADVLLQELQKRRVHIAIVVDEYGGTAGLVTIEDLLEQIVGEIQDEYDSETPEFERLSLNELMVDARLNLDEVNQFFNTRWESAEVDTVGGFVYDKLARMPKMGDMLTLDRMGNIRPESEEPQPDDVVIVVMSVNGQRLRKLRLMHYAPPPETSPSEENPPAPKSSAINLPTTTKKLKPESQA